MTVRGGRHLTDEAAERAHATIQSHTELSRLGEANLPQRERFERLKHLESRASFGGDAHGLALELGHPINGPELNNQLFGLETGTQFFDKYSRNSGVAENYAKLSRKQKDEFSMEVITDLRDALADTQLKMAPYFKAYEDSRHESEAFANGDLAASFHPPRYILRSSSKVN